jgi:MFS family permease
MSATTTEPAAAQGWSATLWRRQLDTYPSTGPRIFYLALTVISTIVLYYELYVGGSVSTILLPALHMSFTFFLYSLAIGNVLGAFGAIGAGLADRLGRANMVVYGLLFTGIFVAFVIPTATNKYAFVIETFIVGVVEGICLVATPALIRDFTPQTSRAAAMGFWTSGPVVGSLIVATVGTATLPAVISNTSIWTHEFRICGIAGLVVFVVAWIGLRELNPGLRDQLMVTMRDRMLIQARAKGIDVLASLKNPWRQMLKTDVIVSSLGVSVMLLVYYTLVGFGVIMFAVVFGESTKNANGLQNWAWGANVIGVIIVGFLSDRLKVRKPFMVVGALASAVFVVLFDLQIGGHPSYHHIAFLLAGMLFFLGIAFAPWLASFTETLESRNPALIATGLAVQGYVLRIVVFATFLITPAVVSAVNPIASYGGQVTAYLAKYPSLNFAASHPQIVATATKDANAIAVVNQFPTEVAALQKNPALAGLLAQMAKYPSVAKIPPALLGQAITAAGGGAQGITVLTTIAAHKADFTLLQKDQAGLAKIAPFSAQLTALSKVPKSVDAYMTAHGAAVGAAAKQAPGQFKTWFWVCFGGLLFFVLWVPLLKGRWRTRDAVKDQQEHEALVQAELAKIGS